MSIPLRIGELEGEALHSDAVTMTFVAPKAFPPGQPIAVVLWPDTPEALPLALRSIGSKRRRDGDGDTFEVRARLINLARAARERVLATFQP
jgi:hypothetical protein